MSKDTAASPMSLWRSGRFLWFAAGNFSNNLGDSIYVVALPLFIYHLTRQLTAMSIMATISLSPLILGPVVGVFVDRWSPGRLVVPSLLIQLAASGLIPILNASHALSMDALYVLGGLIEFSGSAYRRSWMAALPWLFPQRSPEARVSLHQLYVATTLLGPLAAGLLIGRLGYMGLIWLNVATFLIPIIVAVVGVPFPRVASAPSKSQFWSDLRDGWKALRTAPLLLNAMIVRALQNLVTSTGLTTLLMYYLRATFGLSPARVSVMVVAGGAGGFIGSLLAPMWGRRSLRMVLPVGSLLAAGTVYMLLWPVWGAVPVVLFLVALATMGIFTAIEQATFYEVGSDQLGRVSGLFGLVAGVPAVLSPLVLAVLSHMVSPHGTFLVIAGFMTVIAGIAGVVTAPMRTSRSRS